MLWLFFSVLIGIQAQTTYVHMIPHSHDDVGWLKTVDQYYTGAANNIQPADVRMTISSVMRELEKNPQRTFMQVEVAFFSQWYEDQPQSVRDQVKKFVKNG